MECMWCNEKEVKETMKDCYWITPDGTAAVEILQVPAMYCQKCGSYLTDEMNHEVDVALASREIPKSLKEITYKELMQLPYKNIFSTISD